jgi:5,10-methylenetetrahydromethanopterin reductase
MEGHVFQLRGARLAFKPSLPIPIFVASTGPQILHLSGRIADGVLFSGGLSLDFTRRCVALADQGVRAAGRDLSAVRKAGFVYFACSRNGSDAIQANREKLAFLFRNKHQDENIATVDKSIDHAAIMALVKQRDIPGAARLVPEEAVQQFSVAGTPAECRRGLQAYIDAGVDEPVIEVSGTAVEKALALDVIRDFTGGGAS